MTGIKRKLVIVVHEIYGVNKHIQSVCASLKKTGFDVICPNLLEKEAPFDYSLEEVAYQNFKDNIGFVQATTKIKALIEEYKDEYDRILIVGFSVGATIAWLCSEEIEVNGVVGYYGSRIRDFLEIQPKCPTMLFFPQREKSFNVDEIIENLEMKEIEVYKIDGEHGFSDPFNTTYNESAAKKSFDLMTKFLMEIL